MQDSAKSEKRLGSCVRPLLAGGVITGVLITLWYVNIISINPRKLQQIGSDQNEHISASRVRILCFVPTSPRNLPTKATAVKETWSSRCDVRLFFSSVADPSFPAIGLPEAGEGIKSLTAKSMAAFNYIYKHHFKQADWFLKADDDSYVIVDNLRYLLSHYNPSDALYLGHHLQKHVPQGYMSGGAAYVLSKEALHRLATLGGATCRQKGGAEDVAVGRCLHQLGVSIAPSLDIDNRESFHPFNLATHLFGQFPEWYKDYVKHGVKSGRDCCSEYSVTFHYVDPVMMHVMDHLLYRTTVYGRQRQPSHRAFATNFTKHTP